MAACQFPIADMMALCTEDVAQSSGGKQCRASAAGNVDFFTIGLQIEAKQQLWTGNELFRDPVRLDIRA